MLRAPTSLRDTDTLARLRRALSVAEGPRTGDAMARAASFSRRQFHRLALQLIGETPAAHQRRLRLDRAGWLLLTSRATVLDIALAAGFESHESFTRAFRRQFRLSPSAFRAERGRTLPRAVRAGFSIALRFQDAAQVL
jgi:transcriptional regulator GlxA family with amidase domain